MTCVFVGSARYGDTAGKVRLYRFPSLDPQSKYLEGAGHASHVTCVRWSADDQFVLSTGGVDRTVMQWRVRQWEDADELKRVK